jgi:hypothetical protein
MEPKHVAKLNFEWQDPYSQKQTMCILEAVLAPVVVELSAGNDVDVSFTIKQSRLGAVANLTVSIIEPKETTDGE